MSQFQNDLDQCIEAVNELYNRAKTTNITLERGSPDYSVLGIAFRMLVGSKDTINDQLEIIRVYADPEFYKELPPSKASLDRGQYAKQYLAMFENA